MSFLVLLISSNEERIKLLFDISFVLILKVLQKILRCL